MFMPRLESLARHATRARPVSPIPSETEQPAARPAEGMLAGTLVETIAGWVPVERLHAGDAVYTQDGGLRQVRATRHLRRGPCPRVLIPGGALGNDNTLALPAGQLVQVDGEALAALFDLPLGLARAGDLLGLDGIHALAPAPRTDLWQLIFDEEELVWAAGALRLHCPPRDCSRAQFFERLSPAQARLYALSTGSAGRTQARAA